MNRNRTAAIAATAVAALALTACSTPNTGADGQELTKLRVATTVIGETYWSYYYTPDYLGYYEEEGLDVEIVPINTGVTQTLLAGQIEIGGAGFDFVQQGGNVSGLAWYMMTDRHLFAPMVLDDSPIRDIKDLEGKKIGINEPNDSFDADFVLASNGVRQGSYELIPIGEAAPAAIALEGGQVDALIMPATTTYLRAQDAIDSTIRIIDAPSSSDFYNTGLMSTREWLDENRDIAIKFGRAIAKGIIWMHENPEAVATMIMENEPDAESDLAAAIRSVTRAAEWNRPIYDSRGVIDGDVFEREIAALFEVGLIDAVYDHESLFVDGFAEEIWNSFDVDAIIAEARAG